MTIRTRRRIFYTLVALFFIVGGGVVFYADGWRLDFQTWHFTKIGGIYVRAFPENASIYLDGKPVPNQSGFLAPGTLISDLLPQTYSVVLKAAGYDDWQENAGVLASQVVQDKYAVLVPANGTPVTSTSTAKQIELMMNAAGGGTGGAGARALAGNDATTTDPFDQNQKLVVGKNKISIFNIAQATTTQSVAIPGIGNIKTIATKWISGNVIGILQSDGSLYLYNTNTSSDIGSSADANTNANANSNALTKLAETVKSFSATADGSMIAALETQSLEIFSLGGQDNYYRFNIPDITDAKNIIWYKDSEHLFVVYADHVSFLDLADTGLTNFVTVANDGNETLPFYDPQSNTLYITSADGKLLQFAFPN